MEKSSPKRNVILFDGHNMLFRYFWGMPCSILSSDGRPIHAAYGFIAAVLNHIRRFQPVAVVVCFDSQGRPERTDIMEEYKANRTWAFEPGSPDNPFSQFGFIQTALAHLNIPSIEIAGIEADDLIGSYAKAAKWHGFSVTIASTDKDFLQLVDEDICVYVRRGKRERFYTPQSVVEQFAVLPSQYVDYKSLTGDHTDNITGVPGIGPKTASKLLSSHKTVESIYARLTELRPRLATSLTLHKEQVFLNKRIIKINTELVLNDTYLTPSDLAQVASTSPKQVFKEIGLW